MKFLLKWFAFRFSDLLFFVINSQDSVIENNDSGIWKGNFANTLLYILTSVYVGGIGVLSRLFSKRGKAEQVIVNNLL